MSGSVNAKLGINVRIYCLHSIVLSIPPILWYTVRKGRRRQNVHYNFNLGDVLCGEPDLRYTFTCTAAALARRKNALPFAAVSMGLCSLALLGQIFEYNVRVYAQDFSALLDTSFAIRFCAVVLFLLAAVVNAGVCMYQMKRSAKQHPQH